MGMKGFFTPDGIAPQDAVRTYDELVYVSSTPRLARLIAEKSMSDGKGALAFAQLLGGLNSILCDTEVVFWRVELFDEVVKPAWKSFMDVMVGRKDCPRSPELWVFDVDLVPPPEEIDLLNVPPDFVISCILFMPLEYMSKMLSQWMSKSDLKSFFAKLGVTYESRIGFATLTYFVRRLEFVNHPSELSPAEAVPCIHLGDFTLIGKKPLGSNVAAFMAARAFMRENAVAEERLETYDALGRHRFPLTIRTISRSKS